jgi:hypothetical protein
MSTELLALSIVVMVGAVILLIVRVHLVDKERPTSSA